MSGRGKGKSGKKPVSRSSKAGLQFPVGRIARYLKKGRYATREPRPRGQMDRRHELMERRLHDLDSPLRPRDNKKNRIELSKLLGGVTIASGGVLPNIHSVLLPKSKGKKGEKDE
ncbi:histone H2A [Raphidocelis subcapitata]|uniref:Histone H2A n=1 Tax=Raphidocelis subcapitata TaxID=307507 RepID=A0A2V0NQX5_9CHLO|nr:histone H2A [Raphidocelis subcapitata]|eukprot:GBF89022.1 histone H2A [Raphidocelis subcapitata]